MTNKKNLIFSTGLILSLAIAMFISVPRAQAYVANITAGSDLTLGSTGQSVEVLQGLLAERGFLDIAYNIPLGYFGSMTKEALGRYQASLSVSPTAGYFGSLTKVSMHKEYAAHNWLTLLGW